MEPSFAPPLKAGLIPELALGGQAVAALTVKTLNGKTGSLSAVESFNGNTGPVTGVSTFNGNTGAVTGLASFNGRTTAAAVPTSGDYTAAQVTNAADKSSTSIQTFVAGLTSAHASQGIGYATGSGGTLSIAFSSLPGTLNKPNGRVTVTGIPSIATGGTGTIQINNSTVGTSDVVVVTQAQDSFQCSTTVGTGVFTLNLYNPNAATGTFSLTFQFIVFKSVSS